MPPSKVDFALVEVSGVDAVVVKPGCPVVFARRGDGGDCDIACSTSSSPDGGSRTLLGLVPSGALNAEEAAGSHGTVRSVKKSPEGKLTYVLVRAVRGGAQQGGHDAAGAGGGAQALRAGGVQVAHRGGASTGGSGRDDDVPDYENLLSAEALQGVVRNADLRAALRDSRLQAVLSQIDGAADREAALKEALKNPNFDEFAQQLLAVVR